VKRQAIAVVGLTLVVGIAVVSTIGNPFGASAHPSVANPPSSLGRLGADTVDTDLATQLADGYWTQSGNNLYPTSSTWNVGVGTTTPGANLEVAKDNVQSALLLTHPDATDPTFDNYPIAALQVAPPPTATTRNFVSGIWVQTNGAATDKGRGVIVVNTGKSDSIYVQQDGAGATGFAAGNNGPNTTGFVSQTDSPSAVAAVVRQGPGGGASTLLTVEANVAGTAEMVRFNSNQIGKVGAIFRMPGSGNKAIVVKDSSEHDLFVVDADTGQVKTSRLVTTGSVGIGTLNPQSTLQVVGNYIQFPAISGAPPAVDCDSSAEAGRMVVRTDGAANLYVCKGTSGWAGVSTGGAVGGIGELPPMAGMGGSPAHNYAIAALLAFVAVVAFAAGGWYARRRWLR